MHFFTLFILLAALATPNNSPNLPAGKFGRVVGRVELLTGEPLPKGCRVLLGPPAPANPDRLDTAKRLADMAVETQPNEQGFFRFAGIKPGIYTLRAEHKDFAPAEDSPIVVRAGLDTDLARSLYLRPLAVLTVQIDPSLDPFDRPWRLRLDGETGGGSREGVANDLGAWDQHGIPPGRWHLSVLGEQEGIWAHQRIDLDGTDQFVAVEVDTIAVEGRALQGKEPFSGTLWFGGTRGARRVRFDPDENGEFLGLLPGEGEWEVEVEMTSAGLDRLALEPVTIRRRPGQSKARVEIHVPDTWLEGRVVDESGKGVTANLTLIAERYPSLARTEKDGRFHLRGLPAGVISVQAETDELASEAQQISLEDGRPTPEITITVRGRTRIHGVVRSANGPLAGAEIFLWPAFEQGGMGMMARAVTDPEGSFDVALSGTARTIDAVVSAPGYGLSLSRQSVPSKGPLVLDLEAAAGKLDLDLAPGEKGSLPQGLLVHRGAFIPAAFLSRWGTFEGETRRLTLSAVEAGDWTLCDHFAEVRENAASNRCAQGVLFPGGQLALKTGSR